MMNQNPSSNDQMAFWVTPRPGNPRCSTWCLGIPPSFVIRALSFLFLFVGLTAGTMAQTITRAEALRVAESYVQHRWEASSKNVLHGKDKKGVEVHTPDHEGGCGSP